MYQISAYIQTSDFHNASEFARAHTQRHTSIFNGYKSDYPTDLTEIVNAIKYCELAKPQITSARPTSKE